MKRLVALVAQLHNYTKSVVRFGGHGSRRRAGKLDCADSPDSVKATSAAITFWGGTRRIAFRRQPHFFPTIGLLFAREGLPYFIQELRRLLIPKLRAVVGEILERYKISCSAFGGSLLVLISTGAHWIEQIRHNSLFSSTSWRPQRKLPQRVLVKSHQTSR